MLRTMALLALLSALSACATGSDPTPADALRVQCEPPRPQVCTMEYVPVCATLEGGKQRDYSSGCNACADDAVVSWVSGRCGRDDTGDGEQGSPGA